MIETKEQFDEIHDAAFQDMEDGIWVCFRCGKPLGETEDCRSCQISLLKGTVEALRDYSLASEAYLKARNDPLSVPQRMAKVTEDLNKAREELSDWLLVRD